MTFRAVRVICAVALTIGTWSAPPLAQAETRQSRETRRLCPALAQVDFNRLAHESENDTWRQEARQLLRANAQPDLDGADVVLRFYAPPGFGGGASTWTTARLVAGAWSLRREELQLTSAGPPPFDPYKIDMRSTRSRSPVTVREGPLEETYSAALNAALADPCLAHEPDAAPAALPLRGGRLDVCYDGGPFFLQIERAEGVRTFVHACQPRWRAGEIIRILESAPTITSQSTVINTLTPLILVDAAGNDVPETEAPPPVLLRVEGANSARPLRLELNGDVVFEGAPEPTDGAAAWRIWQPLGAPAPAYRLSISGCTAPVDGVLPAPGGALRIRVDGCALSAELTQ